LKTHHDTTFQEYFNALSKTKKIFLIIVQLLYMNTNRIIIKRLQLVTREKRKRARTLFYLNKIIKKRKILKMRLLQKT